MSEESLTAAEKSLENIMKLVSEIRMRENALVNEIKNSGVIEENEKDPIFKSINNLKKGFSIDDYPVRELSLYLEKICVLPRRLEKFEEIAADTSVFGVARQRAEREAERRDDWISWRHRLLRWSIGAGLTVLLYSVAVWLHEIAPFFKVPIHHTVTEAAKEVTAEPAEPAESVEPATPAE